MVAIQPLVGAPERTEPSTNGTAEGPACIFCGRPSVDTTYAWPDWLCRFVAGNEQLWESRTGPNRADLVIIERAEMEADKTITCVCTTCSTGWMQRLEDNVSPFLTSMILGDSTPLPPARRKLLARWAAKTAIVLECASCTELRTPHAASEHVRRTGAHPGMQVLVGRYDGRRQLLTAERDVSIRTVAGETRHLSQSSLVMGDVLMQVYADPWRDDAPALTENAVRPFIALIGNRERNVEWPPGVSIDDALYDLVRLGPMTETHTPLGSAAVQEGQDSMMANHQRVRRDEVETPAVQPDVDLADFPARDLSPGSAHDEEPSTPETLTSETLTPEASIPETSIAATTTPETSAPDTSQRRPLRRSAYAAFALALVVVICLLGFGLHEHSNATTANTRTSVLVRQTQALEAQLRLKNQQLAATQARLAQLADRVSR